MAFKIVQSNTSKRQIIQIAGFTERTIVENKYTELEIKLIKYGINKPKDASAILVFFNVYFFANIWKAAV